jgi:nucleoside-diphosphate-sugar epimerase
VKVVVTGGSGRVGTYVVAELQRAGHEVCVADIAPPAPGVSFRRTDVMDLVALRAAFEGADAVAHLAGLDSGTRARGEDYIRINVVGTWHALQAARDVGLRRIVLTSSITATGLHEARADFPPSYLPVDEAHPCRPTEPYGVSKFLVEEAARRAADAAATEIVVLRPMWVIRPPSIARAQEMARDPRTRSLFDQVSARDVARAFRFAIETADVKFGVFFVTAADTCTEEPTLDLVRRMWPDGVEIRRPELYAADPRAAVFDGAAAAHVLGFTPRERWPDLARRGC